MHELLSGRGTTSSPAGVRPATHHRRPLPPQPPPPLLPASEAEALLLLTSPTVPPQTGPAAFPLPVARRHQPPLALLRAAVRLRAGRPAHHRLRRPRPLAEPLQAQPASPPLRSAAASPLPGVARWTTQLRLAAAAAVGVVASPPVAPRSAATPLVTLLPGPLCRTGPTAESRTEAAPPVLSPKHLLRRRNTSQPGTVAHGLWCVVGQLRKSSLARTDVVAQQVVH